MHISETPHNTSANWVALNPVLAKNETGYEDDTGLFKVGDGVTSWNGLDYSIPTPSTGGGGGVSSEALEDHILDTTPHPVYDDGPSLDLLYANAKV